MTRRSVMISSTARDLPEHREQVRLGCERAGFEPREMMENLTAENRGAVETSLRMVEQADVYLGIFAYRYGTVPEGSDISITEMEFNRAVEKNKSRLIFLIHEEHPIVRGDVETGPAEVKLSALKDRLSKERVAAFFRSPEDLRANVVEALTRLAKELDTAQTVTPLRAWSRSYTAGRRSRRRPSLTLPIRIRFCSCATSSAVKPNSTL